MNQDELQRVRSLRHKIRGNGRSQIGTVHNLTQMDSDQVHKLDINHDQDTWCNHVAEGSTRTRKTQIANRLEGGGH